LNYISFSIKPISNLYKLTSRSKLSNVIRNKDIIFFCLFANFNGKKCSTLTISAGKSVIYYFFFLLHRPIYLGPIKCSTDWILCFKTYYTSNAKTIEKENRHLSTKGYGFVVMYGSLDYDDKWWFSIYEVNAEILLVSLNHILLSHLKFWTGCAATFLLIMIQNKILLLIRTKKIINCTKKKN